MEKEVKKSSQQQIIDKVEKSATSIDEMIDSIIAPYCLELDEYIDFVKDIITDSENPPTDIELEDMSMNLATLIYYASVGCEQMGIRDDISKSIYKEAYNNARNLLTTGTVADKNAQAEIDSREEQVVNIIYNKSFKILKAKVETAQELLGSVKKSLTRRVAELETTRMGRN